MIHPPHNSTPRRSRRQRLRAGFTLVELLVVGLIIAIMATAVLFALMGVTEEGKKSRTRSQIDRINQLMLIRWEGYQTRAVQGPFLNTMNYSDPLSSSRTRLNALHELMRLELPDRISDLEFTPALVDMTAIAYAYRAERDAIATASGKTWTAQHQGAECLFLIISQVKDGNYSGLDFFRQAEIGDVDNDGMPEILDAWGTPITFVRWPAGYRSPLQTGNATEDPDPFDVMRVRAADIQPTFKITPLIASAGPDKTFNLLGDLVNGGNSTVKYSDTTPPNDPYAGFQHDGAPRFLAEPLDPNSAGHLDNITNHLQDI